MKKLIPLLSLALFCYDWSFAQCTTTNATSCVCETPGATNCDLLPDIIVGRPPLEASGTNGVIEYSQTGNGVENGRLRVSVTTPNIGHGPLEVRSTNKYICGTDTIVGTAPSTCPNTGLPPRQLVIQRVYKKVGNTMTFYDRDAGSMTYHPTHGHMHVDDWGIYTLRTATANPDPLTWPIIGTGAKLAFCLMDYGSCSYYNGHCVDSLGNTLLNGNFPNYGLGGGSYNCSSTIQGISSGYTDIYYQYLDGMYITIPPGTCNGDYYIVVQLDPYDYFLEENENNNVIAVPYTLTKQVASGTATITASTIGAICSSSSVTLTANTGTGYTYLWSNGATTPSITVSTAGNYIVTATTPCGTGVSSPHTVSVIDIPPVTTNAQLCGQGTASLSANAGGGIINWYNAPTGGASLGTGNTYVTPLLNTTTTYYAQATTTAPGFSGYSQPNANTIGGGGYFTGSQYQIFDVLQTLTLESVKVYAQSATSTTVQLRNSAGTLITSLVANIPSGESRITLNWSIPPGTGYRLTRSGSAALYRNNSGVNYPYTLPGYLSITGSSGGAAFYYFFYDWEIGTAQQVCVSDRVPATVTVHTNPVVSLAAFNSVCQNANAFSLTGGAPSGGTYSGVGVTNNSFDPAVAGVGTHTITYDYTDGNGCSGSATAAIVVNALPSVTLSAFNSVCQNANAFSLTGGAPSGGTYSGVGVTNNSFDPAVAGVGTHTITYDYTDGNGCSGSATSSIVVSALPSVTLSSFSTVCESAPSFSLTGGAPSGGIYSGIGVTNNSFDPSAAGSGTHTITYQYTDGNGCSGSATAAIVVNAQPTVTLPAFNSICHNAASIALTGGSPSGGTYSGVGVANNSFDPSIAGIGVHTITYDYTDGNGCSSSASNTITVNNCGCAVPNMPSGFQGDLRICPNTPTAYSVTNSASADSYTWVAPAGITIISGQGTHAIMVVADNSFESGDLCAYANNACGSSTPRCRTITKNTSRIPGAIQGGRYGHCDLPATFSIAPVWNATSYVWTPPAGSTIISGQGTTQITFTTPAGFVSGQICVTSHNGCVESLSRCLTIYGASERPVLTGPLVICPGQTYDYLATSTYGTASYNWTIPSGSAILSGQGTPTINMLAGANDGRVRVLAVNNCGNRGYATLNVTATCRMQSMEGQELEMIIQPNPANESAMLLLTGFAYGQYQLSITNILGMEVYKDKVNYTNEETIPLQLDGLSKGVYVVTIHNNGYRKSTRLVIQ